MIKNIDKWKHCTFNEHGTCFFVFVFCFLFILYVITGTRPLNLWGEVAMFFPEPENVFETKKTQIFSSSNFTYNFSFHFFSSFRYLFFIDKNWREKFFFQKKKIITQPHPLIVKLSFSTTKKACIQTHHLYCLGKGGVVITKCFYAIQIQSYLRIECILLKFH